MSLLKALFLGGILTFVVAGLIGAGHSTGGYLNIFEFELSGHYIHWSWPLFVVSTGGIWGILLLME
ncbi:MAG: hypothetical protein JF595_14190 [Sphingomonadales bacterium]|nr:hypothetical protein [Sphingomonadales bacterium]